MSNGIQVCVVAGGFQEVVKVELVFDAGRWYEGKTGAAYFASHLLSKGTGKKNSFEIAQLLDQYGAHLEVSPGMDFVSVSLYALTKTISSVLSLLVEILSDPAFPAREIEQAKSIFAQNLKVNNEKTSYLASKLFRKRLFGEEHAYGKEIEERDVNALEARDLRSHFTKYIHSPLVFLSGKIDAATRDLVLEMFEKLPVGTKVGGLPHNIMPGARSEHVKKEDTVQSSVRMGSRFPQRHDPDYVPVLFVTHLLGGYFGSRLMKNLREDKGLTYGISASIHGMKHDSYLVIGADVNKENVTFTFEEIRKELKNLRTTKVPAGELETARNHFIGSLQSEIATPFAHADKIKTIKLFNLHAHHYQRMIDRIEKISPSEIIRISERYFDERSFFEIAVG